MTFFEVRGERAEREKINIVRGAPFNHCISCMLCFPAPLCMFTLKIIEGLKCGVHGNYITAVLGVERDHSGVRVTSCCVGTIYSLFLVHEL